MKELIVMHNALGRWIIAAAWVLAVPGIAQGQTPEQIFQQANDLFQQGRTAEARDAYEMIVKNGYVSGELYYNLGNAYYKTGNIPGAILNYERALRLMPGDEDLLHNLQLANLLITDRLEPAPRLFIWDTWDGVKGFYSARTYTWLAYGAFLLVLCSMILILLTRRYALRKAGVIACAAGGLFLAFLLVIVAAKISDDRRTDEAIVLATITTIKNSPDAKSSDAFVLHAGVKVQIIDGVSDWLKIRLPDGKVGWMERAAAQRI